MRTCISDRTISRFEYRQWNEMNHGQGYSVLSAECWLLPVLTCLRVGLSSLTVIGSQYVSSHMPVMFKIQWVLGGDDTGKGRIWTTSFRWAGLSPASTVHANSILSLFLIICYVFRPLESGLNSVSCHIRNQNKNLRFAQHAQETCHWIDVLVGVTEVLQVVNTSFMNVVDQFDIYEETQMNHQINDIFTTGRNEIF